MAFGLGLDATISSQHRTAADYQCDADFPVAAWHRYKLRLETRF